MGQTEELVRFRRGAVAGPPGPLPTWLQGLAVNGWTEISGSSLSLAPTMSAPNGSGGTATKQNAWCGWHIDTRSNKIYSVGQGGHDDYHGNEVDVIDMHANSPAWSELVAASGSGDVTSTADYYTDGKPTSVHGYYTSVCVPAIGTSGKLLRFPGAARSTNGGGVPDITAFDITNGTYDGSGTWAGSGPGGSWNTGESVFVLHPTTGDVWVWRANTDIRKWTPGVPGSWPAALVSNPANPAVLDTAGAIDPTRGSAGMLYCLGGGSSAFSRRVDLSDGTIDTITLTGTDLTGNTAMGLVYSQTNDRYYACTLGSGSTVYEITPTSGTSWACAALSTTGGGSIPTTSGNAQGPRTKFLYTPSINGNSAGGVFYGPVWSANIWFLRLH